MTDINSITITDPVYKEKSSYNFIERFFISLLIDKRDFTFIKLCGLIFITTIPFAVYLFIPGNLNWWLVLIYYAFNFGVLTGSFILMLHLTSHRPLFKMKYSFLNNIIPWVIGPFFGETPESYFAHHLGMHHAEDNMPSDLSSTMKYQRDSFGDFMKYYFDFIVYGLYDLAVYLKIKKRTKIRKNFLLGEFSFWIIAIALIFFNFKASLFVFIIPVFVVRFLMMAGNWGQHAFIDRNDPKNNYTNSINCINVRYNHTCFNDGYHIVHHLKPAMHWLELPEEFLKNIDKYCTENAIIFQGIDFFQVWFLLMTKQYNTLVKKMVIVDPDITTKEQAIALLKERTRKINDYVVVKPQPKMQPA
ncbi:MAG TPA: fatty acid desaturase [Bacteroidia bacterium]|jgi:fatty acid desaturase|nr:fatty acid desaturase [Bacteroidia bacterium]